MLGLVHHRPAVRVDLHQCSDGNTVTIQIRRIREGAKMQFMKPRATLGACKLPTVCLMLVYGVVIGAQAQPQDTKQAKPPRPAPAKSQPAAPTKMVLEPKAMDLLKATSERLAAAKSMSFTAVASYEYPSQLGPPILYTVRYDVAMQRPDKLRVKRCCRRPASHRGR